MTDTTFNRFVASGSTAARLAFTPSPPTPASGPDPGYLWFDTTLSALYAWDVGTSSWIATGGGGGGVTTLISEVSPSGTGTVSFSSIASSYRDLLVVIRGRGTAVATNVVVQMTFNSDTGANYEYQRLTGLGGTPSAALASAQTNLAVMNLPAASATSGVVGYSRCYIGDYANTTFWKAASSDTFSYTTGYAKDNKAMIWHSTSAINRIDLVLASGDFAAGSVVSLYGIT